MRLHSPAITGSLTLSGSAVSTGNLTVGGLLNVQGSNGFAVGSLGDVVRIDSAGDSNNTFRFLAANGQLTGINAKQALFTDDILTSTGNVSGSVSSTGSFGMVGVLNAAPESKLHIGGANLGGVGNAFMVRGDNGDVARILAGATGAGRALMVGHLQSNASSQAIFEVKRGNTSNDAFATQMFMVKTDLSSFPNGNVGIGTTSPAVQFHVS